MAALLQAHSGVDLAGSPPRGIAEPEPHFATLSLEISQHSTPRGSHTRDNSNTTTTSSNYHSVSDDPASAAEDA